MANTTAQLVLSAMCNHCKEVTGIRVTMQAQPILQSCEHCGAKFHNTQELQKLWQGTMHGSGAAIQGFLSKARAVTCPGYSFQDTEGNPTYQDSPMRISDQEKVHAGKNGRVTSDQIKQS